MVMTDTKPTEIGLFKNLNESGKKMNAKSIREQDDYEKNTQFDSDFEGDQDI